MSKDEIIKWLQNLKTDIGQTQHQDLWHYEEMLDEVINTLELNNKDCGINDCHNCDVAWCSNGEMTEEEEARVEWMDIVAEQTERSE